MNKNNERPVGKTKAVGWEIGVRKTLAVSHTRAWNLVTSPEGIQAWLGEDPGVELSEGVTYTLGDGTTGEMRVFKPLSHLRITWQPKAYPRPSTIQVRVIPKDAKTVIAFHQEHLPGPEARAQRRVAFKTALEALESMLK